MLRPLLLVLLAFTFGCNPVSPDPADDDGGIWGQAALDFVSENLVGSYDGEWALSGLDATDTPVEQASWSDTITASNPRIEEDRALVDVASVMDGGTWTQELEFLEGVYIEDDGSVGAYFFEVDAEITISTETSPGVWEYDAELTAYDYSAMANVTADNLIEGSNHSVKVVSYPDGVERHDITTTTHVEYDAGEGLQVVEFTSLQGYHRRAE